MEPDPGNELEREPYDLIMAYIISSLLYVQDSTFLLPFLLYVQSGRDQGGACLFPHWRSDWNNVRSLKHTSGRAFTEYTRGRLYGITILQTYIYYKRYGSDSTWLKGVVSPGRPDERVTYSERHHVQVGLLL